MGVVYFLTQNEQVKYEKEQYKLSDNWFFSFHMKRTDGDTKHFFKVSRFALFNVASRIQGGRGSYYSSNFCTVEAWL